MSLVEDSFSLLVHKITCTFFFAETPKASHMLSFSKNDNAYSTLLL